MTKEKIEEIVESFKKNSTEVSLDDVIPVKFIVHSMACNLCVGIFHDQKDFAAKCNGIIKIIIDTWRDTEDKTEWLH